MLPSVDVYKSQVKTYEPAAVSDALVYLDTAAAPLEPLDAWYADDVLTAAAVSLAARILQEGVPVRVIYLKDRRMERRLTSLEELPALRRELAAQMCIRDRARPARSPFTAGPPAGRPGDR